MSTCPSGVHYMHLVDLAREQIEKTYKRPLLELTDPHLCCGSTGTYNLMQPELASQLGVLKIASVETLVPDVIAAGNIGCMMQIGDGTKLPVVHAVELLDWATGGPKPAALS